MRNPARGTREADIRDGLRLSFAEDAGGIELLNANYRGHHIDTHFHNDFSIGVCLRGGLAFDQGGSKHVAPSGVISALNPGDLHNAYPASDDRWAFLCFLIPVDVLRNAVEESGGRGRVPAFRQRVIEDDALARRLIHLHRVLETSREPLERQSLSLSTFAHLVQRHSTVTVESKVAGRERAAVQRARELLNDCYRRPISLTELAAIAGLSRFHFLRVFRSEVGLTPHVYLNHLRVLEAKRQLNRGGAISQVALHCGFADQSHLARRFKQVLGLTPGQYQMARQNSAVRGA